MKRLWNSIPLPVRYIWLGMVIGQFIGTVFTTVAIITLILQIKSRIP